jgi:GNAT superfamily N-acetyltransferase
VSNDHGSRVRQDRQRRVSDQWRNDLVTIATVDECHAGSPLYVAHRLVPDSPLDIAIARAVLDGCALDERQQRFGDSVWSPKLLDWLLPQGTHDIALAALTLIDAEPVGVLNANTIGPGTRELAVLVSPGWRRRGVGRYLVKTARHLIAEACLGVVAGSNGPARRFVASVAPDARTNVSGGDLEFWLGPVDRSTPLKTVDAPPKGRLELHSDRTFHSAARNGDVRSVPRFDGTVR